MSRKDTILILLAELELLVSWVPSDTVDERAIKAHAIELLNRYRKEYPRDV